MNPAANNISGNRPQQSYSSDSESDQSQTAEWIHYVLPLNDTTSDQPTGRYRTPTPIPTELLYHSLHSPSSSEHSLSSAETIEPQPNHYRDYDHSQYQDRVERTYHQMHAEQTYAFVEKMREAFLNLERSEMSVWDAFSRLENIHDESDPDTDLPQIVHAYQTAEALFDKYLLNREGDPKPVEIRSLFSDSEWAALPNDIRQQYANQTLSEFYPQIKQWDWLPLIGLIHDLGKVMLLPEWQIEGATLPQWAIVGDTFPVGVEFSPTNIFYDREFYQESPDYSQPQFRSDTGIYDPHTGLDNVLISWGHDEYMAKVLEKNAPSLPREAAYLIRYHSLYPWHTPRTGGERGYQALVNTKDWQMLPLLKAFNKGDLYSKSTEIPPIDQLSPYYHSLIDQYFNPGPSKW